VSVVRDCLFNIFAATLLIVGRSSIRNPRTLHVLVTGTHLSHGYYALVDLNNRKEHTCFVLHIYHLLAHPFMIYSLRYLFSTSITVLILVLPSQY
jgi:hypothetical protein